MILKKYQIYIGSLFLQKFINTSLIFFCIVIIINFFEEVRFSEKYNTELYYTIYLSLLNAPSLLFEILPFVFLITIKFFYLELNEKNELEILSSNGISNTKIIYILSLIASLLGVFILIFLKRLDFLKNITLSYFIQFICLYLMLLHFFLKFCHLFS